MKTKPAALVCSGYGLNCEEETKHAFERAGAGASIVHINDIIASPGILRRYNILAFPGGFSYGDDTGSGKAYGNRLRAHLGEALETFLSRDTLAIGICNGFQIATNAGLLPGALIANNSGRYLCRWVDLKVAGESPWLRGLKTLRVPIAHGEGKFYLPAKELNALEKSGGVALRYVKGEISRHFHLPANPNGSLKDIAGVSSRGGRVLGLMPHPERAVRFTHMPHWTYLAERYRREGEETPTEGDGVALFRNAVQYFA
jgi:phosphoribosylformylglycinamidine synthase subunit PurQ / glutaminase